MYRKKMFSVVIGMALLALALAAFAPSGAWAAALNRAGKTTNRIAGEWAGTMRFTDNPNRLENITVYIEKGCMPGDVCGQVNNTTVSCTWELRYEGAQGGRFVFTHSRTLRGACPPIGTGYYRLQKDGTLYREHITQMFTSYGALTRQ